MLTTIIDIKNNPLTYSIIIVIAYMICFDKIRNVLMTLYISTQQSQNIIYQNRLYRMLIKGSPIDVCKHKA